jgi:hypothetical protein
VPQVEEAHLVKCLEVVGAEVTHRGVQDSVGDRGESGETIAGSCGDGFEGGMGVGAGGIEVDKLLVGLHVDLKLKFVLVPVHAHVWAGEEGAGSHLDPFHQCGLMWGSVTGWVDPQLTLTLQVCAFGKFVHLALEVVWPGDEAMVGPTASLGHWAVIAVCAMEPDVAGLEEGFSLMKDVAAH